MQEEVIVHTKTETRRFTGARAWTTLRGDLIVKDATGLHHFHRDSVVSISYALN